MCTNFHESALRKDTLLDVERVTFNAALPDTNLYGDDIYSGGNFNGWDSGGTLMTRSDSDDLSATVTLPFDEGTQLHSKYTRGSWTNGEKGASCEETDNRTATVVYGAEGAMTIEDEVLNWRIVPPCGN